MRNENVNIDMFWPLHDLSQYWWWWKEKGPYPLTTHLKWERSLKGISFKCGKRAAVVGQNSEQLGCVPLRAKLLTLQSDQKSKSLTIIWTIFIEREDVQTIIPFPIQKKGTAVKDNFFRDGKPSFRLSPPEFQCREPHHIFLFSAVVHYAWEEMVAGFKYSRSYLGPKVLISNSKNHSRTSSLFENLKFK